MPLGDGVAVAPRVAVGLLPGVPVVVPVAVAVGLPPGVRVALAVGVGLPPGLPVAVAVATVRVDGRGEGRCVAGAVGGRGREPRPGQAGWSC